MVHLRPLWRGYGGQPPAEVGGAAAGELERIAEYHREHGHIGKRYTEIIHLFNPDYIPSKGKVLAKTSQLSSYVS